MIKQATENDFDRLMLLMSIFYAEEGYPFDAFATQKSLTQLLENESLGMVWTFQEDQEIIGYLVVTFGFSLEFKGRDAFVDELFVLTDHRGKGFGSRALEIAEQHCRALGIAAFHLEVEFENADAKSLYSRKGYKAHSRHLMTKWLDKALAQ